MISAQSATAPIKYFVSKWKNELQEMQTESAEIARHGTLLLNKWNIFLEVATSMSPESLLPNVSLNRRCRVLCRRDV